MQTWQEKLSDYDFILWNGERFDINSNHWVKQAFEVKKYAFAADFIRLYAVYTMGGIYLDSDVEIIKPFDALLYNNIMIAYENNLQNGIEAACFGAEKGNPYIKKCLDYYEGRFFIKSNGSYDVIPLPQIMKKVFDEIDAYNSYTIYPYYYFSSKGKKIKSSENVYAIHHCAGSWVSINEQKWRSVRNKYRNKFGYKLGNIIGFIYFFFICLKSKKDIKKFFGHLMGAVNVRFKNMIKFLSGM
jgi:mannosyltransferase OCH1-like enzyme